MKRPLHAKDKVGCWYYTSFGTKVHTFSDTSGELCSAFDSQNMGTELCYSEKFKSSTMSPTVSEFH